MSYKSPTPQDLMKLSTELGTELTLERCEKLADWIQGFEPAFISLEKSNANYDVEERDYWFPDDKDNPYGAWYVRCEIEGSTDGLLKGKTIAIKDNIPVAGVPMLNGCELFNGYIPEMDALIVDRLLESGLTIAGKAQCEQLCVSGGSGTSSTGPVNNPHRTDFSTGGSSSGSAALVAAGSVDYAIGCDQAGSIRIPSSWSGVCGLKPTHGLVPYTGILGMEASIDHVGPMTTSVVENALVLEAVTSPNGLKKGRNVNVNNRYSENLGRSIKGLKIGVVQEGFGHPLSEPEVDDCVRESANRFKSLGAEVEEIQIPAHLDGISIWSAIALQGVWHTMCLNGTGMNQSGPFSISLIDKLDGWQKRIVDLSPNVQMFLLLGAYTQRYGGKFYAAAKNKVPALREAYDQALSSYDILLMPTTVTRARALPKSGNDEIDEVIWQATNTVFNTCQFDVTGHPALSIPCGLRDGLPVGLQLIASYQQEKTLYLAGSALESSGDWHSF